MTLPQPPKTIYHADMSQTVNGESSRNLSPLGRVVKAYWVTFVVLSSYLWLRYTARFHSRTSNLARLEVTNRRNSRRIYAAILQLQGLYIKVGQLISIMTNFLPSAFRDELEGLQDQVPPRAYDQIEKRLREEFDGKGPGELFAQFEKTPLASASIGQVHRARLHDGREVAVKVQYPDIERVVRSDLTSLRRIIAIIQRAVPAYQGLDNVYLEIKSMILQELDFLAEARNIDAVAVNFTDDPAICFPTVVPEFTTRRVITTEFMEGAKVSDTDAMDSIGVDRQEVARMVVEAYCRQIFHHGIYHADPHPGNILISAGPTIKFLDFGAVAEISPNMRHGIINILQGAINRDTGKVIAALREMGFIALNSDPRVYDRVVDYFHTRFQDEIQLESFNLKDIKLDPARGLENLADLRHMKISLRDITSSFQVPKEWIMLERTVLLLMGLCTDLDPDLNPMEVIRPHIEEFVLGKDRDWSKFLLDTARDVGLSTLALPQEIKKFTTRALQGDMEVSVPELERAARLHYTIAQQVIYTGLAVASFAFALSMHDRGELDVSRYLMTASGVFGLLLLKSIWSTRRWLKRPRR